MDPQSWMAGQNPAMRQWDGRRFPAYYNAYGGAGFRQPLNFPVLDTQVLDPLEFSGVMRISVSPRATACPAISTS